jgi:hypothetical protein
MKTINKIIQYVKDNYKVILFILCVVGIFYWYEIRPSIIRSGCYNQAKDQAIEKGKTEDSATYLFDREHWDPKNGPEPAYINEHLTIISKNNSFNSNDYNTYYKWCLESKGL